MGVGAVVPDVAVTGSDFLDACGTGIDGEREGVSAGAVVGVGVVVGVGAGDGIGGFVPSVFVTSSGGVAVVGTAVEG